MNADRTCVATFNLQKGTIKINKTAVGGNGTFGFTGSGSGVPATFNIATASGTGSQTFANLNPGGYTVTESTLPAGWTFTSLH